AFGLDVIVCRRRPGLGRVGRQGAGNEGGAVVQDGGDGMHLADKGALAAADQAHAQFTIEWSVHVVTPVEDSPAIPNAAGSLYCPAPSFSSNFSAPTALSQVP